MHESSEVFEIQPDPTSNCGVSCPTDTLIMGKMVATFSRLFLIGSISYLQVKMTYMRAWMSLKFGQIRLLVSMATDRVLMEKMVLPLFLSCFSFDPFYTYRVMITCMRARMSSKIGQIRLLTAELAALECLKKSP